MITGGMNYQGVDGKQQAFEDKFNALRRALNDTDGHVRSNLYRDTHDHCSYLILSEWSAEQAFTDFIRSQAFKEVTQWGKEQILTDRPRHKVYKG